MFFHIKFLFLLIPLLSFYPEIFCRTGLDSSAVNILKIPVNSKDSTQCVPQSKDDSIKIERFDHSGTRYDFYYVKLSLFQSDFERLDFYEKASSHGIFIVDKNDFHNDSSLFLTTFDREQASDVFKEIHLSVVDANLSTSEKVKQDILSKSLFYNKETSFNMSDQQKAPLEEFPCSIADVACSANSYQFRSNTVGNAPTSIDGYPNYGCLSSQPAPAWFFMQVGSPGDIVITILQKTLIGGIELDVDFICWGPSSSLTDGCATGLTGTCNIPGQPDCCNNNYPDCLNFYPRGNIVDCSFSGSNQEICTIKNAQVGEMYILLITNYSRQEGTITFSQTGGTGITNCNIVVFCSMLAITADPTACNMANNTFSVSGNIEFSNPSPTGTLTVTDVTATPPIVQSFNPPFISPLAYTLDNIPCDGAVHSLVAVFSDSLTCNLTQTFSSPAAGCPSGTISGGGSICNDGISQATVNINISGPPGPYNFTYAINGASQPPITNYSGPLPYPINTRIPGDYTLVSVSTPACPVGGLVSGNATVILHPLPIPTITGADAVCAGTTDVTYTTEPFMTGYTWVVSSGGTITGGGNTNSIKVSWNTAATNQSVSVNYTDAHGCTAASAFIKNVTVNPLPSPNIAGLTPVCVGQTGVSYTTEPSMTNYSWTVTSGGIITAGGTTNSIMVTWNTAAPNQSVSVNYTDGSGCTAASPKVKNIIVNPLPSPSISGPPSVCNGTTGSSYNTEPFMNGYTWTVSSGGTITSGPGTNTIKVSWSSATPAQSVTVNYANALGCSNSAVWPVTIVPLPVSTFTTTTPSPVCQDSPTPSSYTVDPGGVAASYLWQVTPPTLAVIADATANPASITWKLSGYSAQTAQLSLTATTSGTNPVCSSLSSPMSVLINPKAETVLTSCFDPVTSRSAKPFILKGGNPLPTGTPPQGEYLITPATPALYYQNGNYYFDPALVASPASFEISYKYTNQYNCPSITVPIVLEVRGPNPTCGSSMTDIRDNAIYLTKMIAGKCWMLENLRYGTKLNAPLQPQTDNCLVEKYCLSSDANCTAYGGLYQWDELIQYEATAGPGYQGVCPPGWHVPSQQEWQDMINAVANVTPGDGMAGGTLKDPYASFNALLNGVYYLNNLWAYTTGSPTATMFWTSTPSGTSHAVARGLNNISYSVSYYPSFKANAFPVRCVKD
jgi:uncharacterized protein (TIGR02145 family)